MKQIAVCPCDIPEELREGLAQLCENEGFCLDAAGLPAAPNTTVCSVSPTRCGSNMTAPCSFSAPFRC